MNSSSILNNLNNLTDRQKEQYHFISNKFPSFYLNSIVYYSEIDLYTHILNEQPSFFLDLPIEEQSNIFYLFQFYQQASTSDFNHIPHLLLSSSEHMCGMISLIEPSFHNNEHLKDFMKFLYRFYKHKIPESIIMGAISKEGILIQYANDNVKNNYSIAMKAVQDNGFALGMLSLELRNNINIVKTAVLQSSDHYQAIYHLASKEIHALVGTQNSYKYFSSLVFSEELESQLNSFKTKSSSIKL